MPPKIEMSILPSHITRSDAPSQDLAEQGLPQSTRETDTVVASSTGKSTWRKIAGVGLGVLALGSAIGGAYALGKSGAGHTPGPIPSPDLAKAPTGNAPFATPPAAPAPPSLRPAYGCVAPQVPQDSIFPTQADGSFPGDTRSRQLFTSGIPQIGDIAAAAENPFLLSGGYYPLLESLVAMQPAFVASNVRSDGADANGTQFYSARLFNRPEAFGTPTQGWLKSGLADFSGAVAWPRVYDHAMLTARVAGIDADHPQGPGDLEDNLSAYRDWAAAFTGSPVQALALNAQRATGGQNNATQFADKDDNLPFAVEMMRVNPLLFGSLTFDFNQARTDGTVTLPSNTTLILGGYPEIRVFPNGHPAWNISSQAGGWASYAISGMTQDGINLRLVTDPVDVDQFLPYDAMASAGDILTLGRVYCGSNPLALS